MGGKRFDAGSILSDSIARTAKGDPPAPAISVVAPPLEESYRAFNVFVTPAQHRWLKQMARELSVDDIECSMADLVRLALDELAKHDQDWVGVEWARHSRAEAVRFPSRAKTRKLPPDPD